jgi:hypothetical protein
MEIRQPSCRCCPHNGSLRQELLSEKSSQSFKPTILNSKSKISYSAMMSCLALFTGAAHSLVWPSMAVFMCAVRALLWATKYDLTYWRRDDYVGCHTAVARPSQDHVSEERLLVEVAVALRQKNNVYLWRGKLGNCCKLETVVACTGNLYVSLLRTRLWHEKLRRWCKLDWCAWQDVRFGCVHPPILDLVACKLWCVWLLGYFGQSLGKVLNWLLVKFVSVSSHVLLLI